MNLVKWLRKNNTKIMAVVVILLMIAFAADIGLRQLAQSRSTGANKAVAYFLGNRKISSYDLFSARQELDILRMLQADVLLRSMQDPVFRAPDIRPVMLGELLFADQSTSPLLAGYLKQIIAANEYRISLPQLNDIYRERRAAPSAVYWLLLTEEADRAGIRVSNEDCGRYLADILPQITRGATYKRVVGAIVGREGISESVVLTTFGKLLAVLEYARSICSEENVTVRQIMHDISRTRETMDFEFVRLNSAVFADAQPEPGDEQAAAHFEKYKGSFAGDVSEDNPYGFGYKMPDRVCIEYIIVKLDDVSKIVPKTTNEEIEEYYTRHKDEFTESVTPDPNDPNSVPTKRTRSYGEVANAIASLLARNKKIARAESILNEARSLTEAALGDAETEKLTAEEFKQRAVDYNSTAEQLSKKHKVTVHRGRTGLLNAAHFQTDQYLSRLYVRSRAQSFVGLAQLVFAVEPLTSSELGPFDIQKPRMYENIGPVRDEQERIMGITRVIDARKAAVPQTTDESFDVSRLELKDHSSQPDPNSKTESARPENVYSVREAVVEDLKKLAAMETTRLMVEQFADQAIKEGWENAIDSFNELYGKAEPNEARSNRINPAQTPVDINKPFRLESVTQLQRIPAVALDTLAVQSEGNPAAWAALNLAKNQAMLREKLYSLVPADSNTVDKLPALVEFKPEMSYYCLKDLAVRRVSRSEYEQTKALQAYRQELIQSQSLAVVHFNPENISKRMSFMWVQEEKAADANSPKESQEEL